MSMFKMNPNVAVHVLTFLPIFVILFMITATIITRWIQIINVFPSQDVSDMLHYPICRLGTTRTKSYRYIHVVFMSLTGVGVIILAISKAYLMRRLRPSNLVMINRIVYIYIISGVGMSVMACAPVDISGFSEFTHYAGAFFGIYGICLAQWLDASAWVSYLKETHEVPVTKFERNAAKLMWLLPICSVILFSAYILSEWSMMLGWTRRVCEFEWIGLFLIVLSVFGFQNQGFFIGSRIEKSDADLMVVKLPSDDLLDVLP